MRPGDETEPRYNDIREITMRLKRTERKIFPNITILSVHSDNSSKTLNLT